jgi:hypothetical protein
MFSAVQVSGGTPENTMCAAHRRPHPPPNVPPRYSHQEGHPRRDCPRHFPICSRPSRVSERRTGVSPRATGVWRRATRVARGARRAPARRTPVARRPRRAPRRHGRVARCATPVGRFATPVARRQTRSARNTGFSRTGGAGMTELTSSLHHRRRRPGRATRPAPSRIAAPGAGTVVRKRKEYHTSVWSVRPPSIAPSTRRCSLATG